MIIRFFYSIFILFFFISNNSFSKGVVNIISDKNIYDLGYDVSIYEDSTNKLNIDDVVKKEYESKYIYSKTKVPNLGISNSTFFTNKIDKITLKVCNGFGDDDDEDEYECLYTNELITSILYSNLVKEPNLYNWSMVFFASLFK